MASFLDEKEVNLVNLSLEMDQVALAHLVADNEKIFVTESGVFPFWLQIHPEPQILAFSSFLDLDPTMSMAERYAFCNRVNSVFLIPGTYVYEDCLYISHAMTYRNGLIRSQFISTCLQFANGAEDVRQELASVFDRTHHI